MDSFPFKIAAYETLKNLWLHHKFFLSCGEALFFFSTLRREGGKNSFPQETYNDIKMT